MSVNVTDAPPKPPHARRGLQRVSPAGWFAIGAVVLTLVLAAVLAAPLIPKASVAKVLALGGGKVVTSGIKAGVPEPAPGQTASATRAGVAPPAPAAPVAGQPLRLQIPSVGLDANVGAMSVAPGSAVDPPTAGTAYWLSNYGVAGPDTGNTTYIAGHTSWFEDNGIAVFDKLLNFSDGAPTVKPGAKITVTTSTAQYTYTITGVYLYVKSTVTSRAQLWQKIPNRLILVTCDQLQGKNGTNRNIVVTAMLDGAS